MVSFLDVTGIKPCPNISPNQNALRIASGTEPTLIRKEDTTLLTVVQFLCSAPLETANHIDIREAEDWSRHIDLSKECDIYISSRSGSRKEDPIACGYTEDPFKNRSRNYKPKNRDRYPQNLERQNKNCYTCDDSSHYARDCEKCFKPKESSSTPIIEKTRIV
ncbi:hypothetical protein TNCV_2249991 [Trichonephila clavipes]|nr:hypothetical protein TNCV_2249991 [Trichonephila clavipes]